jgi:hypothetical protein
MIDRTGAGVLLTVQSDRGAARLLRKEKQMLPNIDPEGLYSVDQLLAITNIGLSADEINAARKSGRLRPEGMLKSGPRFRGKDVLDFIEAKGESED